MQTNREGRVAAAIEYRHDNAYKDSAKSPGLGQRMQTDLAKVGVQQPSQAWALSVFPINLTNIPRESKKLSVVFDKIPIC